MDRLSTPQSPPILLSFAASDPSGGAGIQADLLTIAGARRPPAVGGDRA